MEQITITIVSHRKESDIIFVRLSSLKSDIRLKFNRGQICCKRDQTGIPIML